MDKIIQDIGSSANEIESYLNTLSNQIEELKKRTLSSIPWSAFLGEAKKILNEIEMKKRAINKSTIDNILNRSTQKAQAKIIKEQKDIQYLKVALTKGYIFIQKFRSFITKEELEYLLLFNDSSEKKIGKYTLKDLIPTLNIMLNKDGEFTLQINNLDALKDLKKKDLNLSNEAQMISQKIIDLYNKILTKRRQYVKKERIKKARAEKQSTKKITGFARFQEGVAFETAARKIADAILSQKPEIIMNIEKDFRQDTQDFFKAGDLTSEQVSAIFSEARNLALELKAVRSETKSGFSIGAQLAKGITIETALKKIINIIQNQEGGDEQEILKSLKKFYGVHKDEIIHTIDKKIKYTVADQLEKIRVRFSRVKK